MQNTIEEQLKVCFLSSRVCLTETIARNATIVTRIGKDRTPSLAKHNANRAFTSLSVWLSVCLSFSVCWSVFSFIHLLLGFVFIWQFAF